MLSPQLRSAATDGDITTLERLLRNVPLTGRDEEDYTPLHYYAWGGATALLDAAISRLDLNRFAPPVPTIFA